MKIEKCIEYWRVVDANGTPRALLWPNGTVSLHDANGARRAGLLPNGTVGLYDARGIGRVWVWPDGTVSLFDEQMRLRAILETIKPLSPQELQSLVPA